MIDIIKKMTNLVSTVSGFTEQRKNLNQSLVKSFLKNLELKEILRESDIAHWDLLQNLLRMPLLEKLITFITLNKPLKAQQNGAFLV